MLCLVASLNITFFVSNGDSDRHNKTADVCGNVFYKYFRGITTLNTEDQIGI